MTILNDKREVIEGAVPDDSKDAYAELIVFDDDGHEGFYKRLYFTSSYLAAKYFVETYNETYHLKISQCYYGDGR